MSTTPSAAPAPTGAGPFPESLDSARLRLERPRFADAEALRALHQDADVAATLGGPMSDMQALLFTERLLAHWQTHRFGRWIARDRDTGAFVGCGGLRILLLAGEPVVELGYALGAAWWGQGLATELARCALDAGFASLGVREIVSFTLPTNAASRRVMEKLGLAYTGDASYAELPHVVYRQSRTAWEAMRAMSHAIATSPALHE